MWINSQFTAKGRPRQHSGKVDPGIFCGTCVDNAVAPLRVTETAERFDVLAKCDGGGITGQAGALRLGIARALLDAGEYREDLKKAGYLTRDPRAVERKKYGLKKARKRPQFSKR